MPPERPIEPPFICPECGARLLTGTRRCACGWTDEPPFISIFTELIQESMRLTGCRGESGVPGLGTCCDYHEGFWDGMHALAGRDGSDAS
jgi:hypothetical protein